MEDEDGIGMCQRDRSAPASFHRMTGAGFGLASPREGVLSVSHDTCRKGHQLRQATPRRDPGFVDAAQRRAGWAGGPGMVGAD